MIAKQWIQQIGFLTCEITFNGKFLDVGWFEKRNFAEIYDKF